MEEEGTSNEAEGETDWKKIVIWIIIAILVIAVVYVLFFRGSATGSAISSAGQAAQGYGGMVGGC